MNRNNVDVTKQMEVTVPFPDSVFSGENTYTTLFLIPAFDIHLDQELYSLFLNAYVGDEGIRHLFRRPLFMLLNVPRVDEGFHRVDGVLRHNPSFVYTYSVGKSEEGGYLFMYVFECPEAFRADYDKFLHAKYSEFSPAYKSRFHKLVPDLRGDLIENPIYGVLHKTPTLKRKIERILEQTLEESQEYFGALKKEFEVFRIIPKPLLHDSTQVPAAEDRPVAQEPT